MNKYQTFRNPVHSGTSIFVITAIFFICTAATIAYSVNFSGEWKLNEQKSEMGQFGGRGTARTIKVISSDASAISMERISTNQNGEQVVRKESLTFDGKESESAGGFGNSTRKSTAKWSEDGKAMIINSVMTFERNGEKMEIKQTETWKLSEDGQTLMIEAISSSSRGDNTMKLVYEKAK
jgi:hypothetical protein